MFVFMLADWFSWYVFIKVGFKHLPGSLFLKTSKSEIQKKKTHESVSIHLRVFLIFRFIIIIVVIVVVTTCIILFVVFIALTLAQGSEYVATLKARCMQSD